MKLSLPTSFPITQKWGENPSYYKTIGLKGHNGWDFGTPIGSPIYATHDGVVNFAGIDPTLSNTVTIDSVDGLFRTFYGHLSSYCVTGGQSVKQGEQIGLSGNSGRYTTGPHLHFGLHHISNYSDVDPNNGWNGACDPAPYFYGITRNLYLGCSGEDVLMLQTLLKSKVTGYYGPMTVKAVMQFQKDNGISQLGIVGPATRTAINRLL